VATSGLTLTDFVLETQGTNPNATGELSRLLLDIASCCNEISWMVQSAGIRGAVGMTGDHNSHGEAQVPLDQEANQILSERLKRSHHVGLFLSEESKTAVKTRCWSADFRQSEKKAVHYKLVFDPLDGSKLVDEGGTVGTIFGIFRVKHSDRPPEEADFLQPASELVAAGMGVYGSQTKFLYTTRNGVHHFDYDPSRRDWVLVNDRLMMPAEGDAIYSVNDSNELRWKDPVSRFVRSLKAPERKYNMKYAGSLVADGLRVLMRGASSCIRMTRSLRTESSACSTSVDLWRFSPSRPVERRSARMDGTSRRLYRSTYTSARHSFWGTGARWTSTWQC
jgi:fructose-1,6-bisphosphatase I